MEGAPTLLFCVGAARAGTSWAYRYLLRHPDCHLRSIKELHYFDTLEGGQTAQRLAELRRERNALKRALREAGPDKPAWLVRQTADVEELIALTERGGEGRDAYLAYLDRGAEGRRLVADLTPAYALLPEARLAEMAMLRPAVRFLYLMRDPVDRLWSHALLMASRRAAAGEDDLSPRAARILERALGGGEPEITRRGDYETALRKLARAVPSPHLMVEFSERLGEEAAQRRLCSFLGIGYRPAEGPEDAGGGPPEALRQRAARALAAQYDFVGRMHGPLPARWQASLETV
ncbi:MAG: sulfotransferase [Rhodobacteraceae bacterium]|nr:sulfotransferase [Paracoccaceae bacterium]